MDEISWLNAIVDQRARVSQAHAADSTTDALKLAAATVLERGAAQLDCTGGDATTLRESVAALSAAIAKVEEAATSQVVAGADSSASTGSDEQRVDEFIARLDPAFRAQELGFSVSLIARNIDLIASAEWRGWWQRMLGRQPTGLAGTFSTAGELASSHVKRHSVWLQNSIRGAVGLGLAVLVADLAGVSRSFWVIFGVLSVLRSSALNTGQSVVRALVGTALGFAASAALLAGMGANANVLWVLLPFVVFLAGVAPAVISFAAGQAAFTLAVVILFNILQPVGWRVGLVRIEDIAIGCGVSLVVGSFFWPRGARAALRHAIAEAYADGAAYLAAAVEFGMGRCDVMRTDFNAPKYAAQRAGASALRLDDAFRNYLAERGAKPYPLADLTPLVTGIAALGLAADAIVDLWKGSDRAARERTVASREIVTVVMAVEGWFDALATCLVAQKELPEPMSRDDAGKARMIDGLRSDLKHTGGATTPTAVRMLWTEEHVDRVRRLQGVIVQRVRAVTERETNTIAPASG